jgi:hypothetical protein
LAGRVLRWLALRLDAPAGPTAEGTFNHGGTQMDTDKKVIFQREHPLTKNQVLKTAGNSLFPQLNPWFQ